MAIGLGGVLGGGGGRFRQRCCGEEWKMGRCWRGVKWEAAGALAALGGLGSSVLGIAVRGEPEGQRLRLPAAPLLKGRGGGPPCRC